MPLPLRGAVRRGLAAAALALAPCRVAACSNAAGDAICDYFLETLGHMCAAEVGGMQVGALCEQRCGRCAGHFVSANGWASEGAWESEGFGGSWEWEGSWESDAGNARCFAVAGNALDACCNAGMDAHGATGDPACWGRVLGTSVAQDCTPGADDCAPGMFETCCMGLGALITLVCGSLYLF